MLYEREHMDSPYLGSVFLDDLSCRHLYSCHFNLAHCLGMLATRTPLINAKVFLLLASHSPHEFFASLCHFSSRLQNKNHNCMKIIYVISTSGGVSAAKGTQLSIRNKGATGSISPCFCFVYLAIWSIKSLPTI